MKLRVRSAFPVVAVLAVACGGTSCATVVACPASASIGPLVAIAYPLPGATGVADASGTLIYGAPGEQSVRLVAEPLATGGVAVPAATATPVALAAATLPAVLPSPIGPLPAGYDYFAESYPQLNPATTYQLQNVATVTPACGPATREYRAAGSFATR